MWRGITFSYWAKFGYGYDAFFRESNPKQRGNYKPPPPHTHTTSFDTPSFKLDITRDNAYAC